jgi:hypothetical protein
MVWVNPDGLRVLFPGDDRIVHGGEYPGAGTLRIVEVEFDFANVGTSATVLDYNIIVPSNSRIQEVVLIAETAATAATSFDFGLFRLDGTTELDHDGLINDVLLASLNVNGEQNTYTPGSSGAGALVGATTTRAGLFSGTRTGTAGVGHGILQVKLYVPAAAPVPTEVD